jgi:CHASE3 domain sensor protein
MSKNAWQIIAIIAIFLVGILGVLVSVLVVSLVFVEWNRQTMSASLKDSSAAFQRFFKVSDCMNSANLMQRQFLAYLVEDDERLIEEFDKETENVIQLLQQIHDTTVIDANKRLTVEIIDSFYEIRSRKDFYVGKGQEIRTIMRGGNERAAKLHMLLDELAMIIMQSRQGLTEVPSVVVDQERAILLAKAQVDATMSARDSLYHARTEEERERWAKDLPISTGELEERLKALRRLMADNKELAAKVEQCLQAQAEWKAFAQGFAVGNSHRFESLVPLLEKIEDAIEKMEMLLSNIQCLLD